MIPKAPPRNLADEELQAAIDLEKQHQIHANYQADKRYRTQYADYADQLYEPMSYAQMFAKTQSMVKTTFAQEQQYLGGFLARVGLSEHDIQSIVSSLTESQVRAANVNQSTLLHGLQLAFPTGSRADISTIAAYIAKFVADRYHSSTTNTVVTPLVDDTNNTVNTDHLPASPPQLETSTHQKPAKLSGRDQDIKDIIDHYKQLSGEHRWNVMKTYPDEFPKNGAYKKYLSPSGNITAIRNMVIDYANRNQRDGYESDADTIKGVMGFGIRQTSKWGKLIHGRGASSQFGKDKKYYLDLKKLQQGTVLIKYTSTGAPKVGPSSVGENGRTVLLHLINTGELPKPLFETLHGADKSVVEQVIFTCGLDVPVPASSIDSLYETFQVLRGQYESGNDNPTLKKQLKLTCLKLHQLKRISKREMVDVLMELA